MKTKSRPVRLDRTSVHNEQELTAWLLAELERESPEIAKPVSKDTTGLFTNLAEELRKAHVI